jgi:hypothetical protein
MFTRDDGAWFTRRMTARGLNPAQMAGHDRAKAAELSLAGSPSRTPAILDDTGQPDP